MCELFISVNLPQKQRQKITQGKNKWKENYFLHKVKISDDEAIFDFRNSHMNHSHYHDLLRIEK